jgi:hypothetical protein
MGDEPVPVVIWLDLPVEDRADGALALGAAGGGGTLLDFGSA